MSTTVAHRVMDQGDQQKVHPFFGNFTKSSKTPEQALPIPDHDTRITLSGQSSVSNEIDPSQNVGSNSQQSYNGLVLQESTLEEDLNIERRKRLKTSENEVPHDVKTEESNFAQPNAEPSTADSQDCATVNNITEKQPKSPPRKVIKLNANGKLLSSPLARSNENNSNKKVQDRRKPNRKENDTKRVVIKYQVEGTTGKKIDDIINGRERYNGAQTSLAQKPDAAKNDLKPPKSTHPFFLTKKPVDKLLQEVQSTRLKPESQSDTASNNAFAHTSTKGILSRSPFAKNPDLVLPLWPPKDLVHVRWPGYYEYETSKSIAYNQRKSKQRAVHVSEAENILNCEYGRIRDEMQFLETNSSLSLLRIPKRSVVSGSTLQKGIDSQLSRGVEFKLGHGFGYQGEAGRAHPCILKLYASIATSITSFDSGNRDSVQWTQKYAPTCAEDVLQAGPEARMLRDWLKNLMVSSIETGNSAIKNKKKHPGGRKPKRRKVADKLDGFIVSSEEEASDMDELVDSDEDELAGGVTISSKRTVIRVGDSVGKFKKGEKGRMTNAVLISGPSGCGKSASVYAVAKELDYEVFEINSGTRRSARDILERVGDMTQNHLVQLEAKEEESYNDDAPASLGSLGAKQNTMNMFFKLAADNKSKHLQNKRERNVNKNSSQDTPNPISRSHKQSLILLEEVDVLFEEDRQFWVGVLALIEQSKRPVIMTCNHEDLVPLQDLSLHAILRYRVPSLALATDYLLVIAANEGHMLKRDAVNDLYLALKKDLRKSIMELNFWCQMAVGSQKSGIDWILDRWPEGSDVDVNGDKLKVISLQTYQHYMGWFSRDIGLMGKGLTKESELLLEGMNWWQLDFDTDNGDSWSNYLSRPNQNQRSIDWLRDATILADSHSDFDILSHCWSLDQMEDELDTTILDVSEKERSNYQEGYPLLVANPKPEFTGISADLGSTANALMQRIAQGVDSLHDNSLSTSRVLGRVSQTEPVPFSSMEYFDAFDPIIQARYLAPQPSGQIPPSFENGVSVVAQDLAPYIRSIVAYDLRLERYRNALSRSTNSKARTTRASRAALEGGSKSSTRRERWFSTDVNLKRILATGSKSWEDALAREGHLVAFPAVTENQTLNCTDSDDSQNTEAESRHGQESQE